SAKLQRQQTISSAHARKKAIKKSGFFDASWYLEKNRDVAASKMDPLEHFVRHGSVELRSPGPKFDAKWYYEEYAEVESSGLDPLTHYLTIGRKKGYDA